MHPEMLDQTQEVRAFARRAEREVKGRRTCWDGTGLEKACDEAELGWLPSTNAMPAIVCPCSMLTRAF